MIIRLQDFSVNGVLAGAVSARSVLQRLLERVQEPLESEILYIDFDGVAIATASFLRETVLVLRETLRAKGSHLYPVVANAEPDIIEEFRTLLRGRGDAILACTLSATQFVSSVHVVGELEPAHRKTLNLVSEHGAVDAATLMALNPDREDITKTAWNNRLAALAARRLVIEIQEGRSKRYRPVLGGV